jgi:hypothetical protein
MNIIKKRLIKAEDEGDIVLALAKKTLELYPADGNAIKSEFGSEMKTCAKDIVECIRDRVNYDNYGEDEDSDMEIEEKEEEAYNDMETCINSLDAVYRDYPAKAVDIIYHKIFTAMINKASKELGYDEGVCTPDVMHKVKDLLNSESFPKSYYGNIMDWFTDFIRDTGLLVTI